MSVETKEHFRRLCLKRLKFFSKSGKIKKDKFICSKILDIINLHKPKTILLYIPLVNEVDVRALISILRKKNGIEVYVPFMKEDSFVPVKYRLPLKKKKFGIKEPKFSPFRRGLVLDMAVVPILGIDKRYRRIGFGKGIYDRFYGRLKYKPITIFTQLKLCKSKEKITSSYDVEPEYIITT